MGRIVPGLHHGAVPATRLDDDLRAPGVRVMSTSPQREGEPETCGLCRERLAAVDSHVYPRALARDIDSSDGPLLGIPSDPEVPLRRLRTGIYGRFLCEPCERRSQL